MRALRLKILVLAAVIAFIGLFPIPSGATSVTINGVGYGGSIGFDYSGINGNLSGGWAGEIKISINGGAEQIAFCVDLDHHIYQGLTYNATANQPISDEKYLKAAYLMNKFASEVDTNIEGAALQTAIWETLYGDKFELKNTTVLNSAEYQKYLAALSGFDPNDPNLKNFVLLQLEGGQWLITRAVPEPSSLILFGTGLLGLGIATRYRKKKIL